MKKLIVLTAITAALITATTPQVWAHDNDRRHNNDFKKAHRGFKVLVKKNRHNARKYAYARRRHFPGKICQVRGRHKTCCVRRQTRQLSKGYRSWDFYMNGYRR